MGWSEEDNYVLPSINQYGTDKLSTNETLRSVYVTTIAVEK